MTSRIQLLQCKLDSVVDEFVGSLITLSEFFWSFFLFHPPCAAFYPQFSLTAAGLLYRTSWKLAFTRQCLKQEGVPVYFLPRQQTVLESVSPLPLPRIFSDLLLSGHYGLNICAHYIRSRFMLKPKPQCEGSKG